ncbi:hypothetical protein Gotur_030061 [Gossypium turneri]
MKIPLQEQGFESISVLKKETREMIQFHRWEKLCTIPTDLVYILILHEFYVTLNETNANRPMNVPWMRILVQEKEISISTPEMVRRKEFVYMDISEYTLQWTRKKEVELLFSHFVVVLCKQTKVPMGQIGYFLQPIKIAILEPSVEYLIGHRKWKRAIKTKPHQGGNVLFDSE